MNTPMKNILIKKQYILVFYFCSTLMLFAQPGTGPIEGDGDTTPTDPLPIDDYLWVLAVVALIYIFLKFRALQQKIKQDDEGQF